MEKLFIIKIGGNIIDEETKLTAFLQSFSSISEKKILIHGGGKLATRLAEKLGIEQQLIDGRRVTDAETLKIVTMVYAGYVNKNIVARLQAQECNAIGLTGVDGNAILAHKRKVADASLPGGNHNPAIDYGFAGDIDRINADFFKSLLDQDLTIVVAPITHDSNGQLLNTNADTIAQEIAKAMSGYYDANLIYCFEKAGVLLDTNDEGSVIRKLNWDYYQQLKSPAPESGTQKIYSGMLPKLDNAFAALNNGVKKVIIGKAEELQGLVKGKSGTTIINE